MIHVKSLEQRSKNSSYYWLLLLLPLLVQLKAGMDTLTGFSEAPDASQNSEMPTDYALSQPHTSVGPLTVCRISSYPHPTLLLIVPVR